MVRAYQGCDLTGVMQIWLEANLEAHAFIAEDYWRGYFDEVQSMIGQAEVYVWEQEGKVCGFLGMMDTYIAGIFVDRSCRQLGIGTRLLDVVKEKKDRLCLSVYKQNQRAVRFYKRAGFVIVAGGIEKETGEEEYQMRWEREKA